MDSCLNSKSAYIFERRYEDLPSGYYDYDVLKYWEKMIGQEAISCLPQAYGKQINELLFFNNQLNQDYKDSVKIQQVDEMIKLYRENVWKEQSILFHGERDLIFYTFSIPFIQCASFALIHRVSEIIVRCVLKDMQQMLAQRLSAVATGTLIYEMQLFKNQNKLKGDSPEKQYDYFCDSILSNPNYIEELFSVYPCLQRAIFECLANCVNNYVEFLCRLKKDHTQLVKKFCANKEFKDLVSCSSGASDSHNGGKSVTIFTLDNGTRVVYKPHSLTVDRRYQECLKSIGVHTKYDMRTIEILDCGDYGWEAYVEQSPCLCIKDIEEYYYRIGVILFCNYLLKAGDIHYENLIAAGAYPMVVDAENVMDNNVAPSHISAREMIFAELGESVLYSGLLPFYKFGHNGQGVDLSALNGQEGKEYPILVPALKNIKRSDMCFEYVNPITRSHSNMAMFDGKLSDPFEHKDNICEGFSDAYNYAMQNPRDVEQLIDSFSNVKVRHLVQDTQRYSMLMHASYHPDVMQDGLSRNLLLCSMFKSYKKVQRTIAVVKEEIRDLLNMDIPYFYTKASGTSLYSSRDEEIKGYFDKSSIDKAHLRLASFNNLDRDKQCRFIKMTLTHIDKQPPAETNTHKIKENKDGDYASKNDIIRAIKFIADQLLEEAVLSEDNKDANWLGVKLVGDYGHGSLSIRPLDVYLYEGVAGICIFFAAISRYYSNYELQRVLSAATKSLFDYTEDILQREGNHIDSSGVFGGESSLVYSYSLLYQLTRNPEYLKYAEKHFPIIERAVQYDQAFDVVYGNAGAILALINLYSLKRDKRYLNCAKTAAKVICDAQQKGGGWKAATVSAPLAGFSHGVAGIVYALNKLYKLYPDKHIKQCIVNGLQYEDELFCEADGNWKDIRKGSTNGKNLCAWCHGAGGILLSRISLLGNIDNETDEIVKEDIRNAVKTMQSHKYLQNPCVCHGRAGNAEILLTYGQQFQDQIASSTAKHFYSRLVGSVNSGTFECSRPYLYGFNIPGFMTGLAGIGYSLLRLLDPTLPSVLQINI